MAADRSFRMAFSQWAAFALARGASAGSMTKPAVLRVALWQVAQYLLRAAAGFSCGKAEGAISSASAAMTIAPQRFREPDRHGADTCVCHSVLGSPWWSGP